MRPVFASIALGILLAGAAAAQAPLDCPGSATAAGRGCETYHFHVQLYRPDTRTFVDLWGVNQFASLPACERAREAQVRRNAAVVDYFQHVRNEEQYPPDRIGTCHCDLSEDHSNPRYLSEAQRVAQIRSAEDVRQRVRERLMDARLTTDSELVRDVAPPPPTTAPLLSGPKMVPIPPPPPRDSEPAGAATDLRTTRAVDLSRPTVANLDLPLVDIGGAPAPLEATAAAVPAPAAAAATQPPPVPSAAAEPKAAQPPAATLPALADAASAVPTPPPAATPTVSTATAVAPSTVPAVAPPAATAAAEQSPADVAADSSAEDSADAFVSYETQRIQNVLKASTAISDEATKSKIFEACMQRIQLLSNLRTLIQSSGARSRLAIAARTATAEPDRLTLIARLFGDQMKSHWAPSDARDVILEPRADVDADAERALRDTSGRYDAQQKKRALYVLLARSQPTEEQQLWLSTVVESFLQ